MDKGCANDTGAVQPAAWGRPAPLAFVPHLIGAILKGRHSIAPVFVDNIYQIPNGL